MKQDSDDDSNDGANLMDEDFELGNEFRENLVPLALEYYLDVIN